MRSKRENCRGLAMVEFLIAAPLCVMVMMAAAEFGRAFLQYNALTKSVRDGARYVASHALNGSTGIVSVTATLQAQAANLVVYGNTLGTGSPVLPGLTTGNVTVVNAGAGNITVTATYSYTSIFAFVPAFVYGSNTSAAGFQFPATMTMRAL